MLLAKLSRDAYKSRTDHAFQLVIKIHSLLQELERTTDHESKCFSNPLVEGAQSEASSLN